MNIPGPDLVCAGFDEMRAILREAWQKNFVAGFSGNASMILADGNILLTAAGSAKGRLEPKDLCVVDKSGQLLCGNKPSSESGMHLAIYAARPDCRAILHTHPPKMLALELRLEQRFGMEGVRWQRFLDVPLYEASVYRKGLAIAEAAAPGTAELAKNVAGAAHDANIRAVWLVNHGLCCLGGDLATALALTEEMEHLARIQLEV